MITQVSRKPCFNSKLNSSSFFHLLLLFTTNLRKQVSSFHCYHSKFKVGSRDVGNEFFSPPLCDAKFEWFLFMTILKGETAELTQFDSQKKVGKKGTENEGTRIVQCLLTQRMRFMSDTELEDEGRGHLITE